MIISSSKSGISALSQVGRPMPAGQPGEPQSYSALSSSMQGDIQGGQPLASLPEPRSDFDPRRATADFASARRGA